MGTRRANRPFTPVELENLRRLWPTAVKDRDLAERFDRSRGVLRRKAEEIGLLPRRRVARRAAS